MSTELRIGGMTCGGCARHVKDALDGAGARTIDVDWRTGRATVEPDGACAQDLSRALDGTKYRVQRVVNRGAPDVASSEKREFDLAIIGSGGGAFAAAIAARRRDLRVVMVEPGTVGGPCANIGCIPSKALLAAAETRYRASQARFAGVSTDAGPADLAELVAAKDEIVDGLWQAKYIDIASEYGIELIEGDARFVEGPAVVVDGRRIEAAHFLVATGAEPSIPDVPGLAASGYLTSTSAMELDELPASMIVIGGGYVALEQAQLFAHLGTRVTMLVRSTLARGEEPMLGHATATATAAVAVALSATVLLARCGG